jgi:excisionase family DNA binding protein
MSDKLLTAKEAAEVLRQKPDFIRDLVRRGVIKGYAIGGPVRRQILIPQASVDAYLEACKVKPPKKQEPRSTKPKHVATSLLEQYAGRAAIRAASEK